MHTRYDFEYEDEDEDQNGDVDIENKYYNAKQMKADNPEEAVDEFLGVPALQDEKGDWYACVQSLPLLRRLLTPCSTQGLQGIETGNQA